MKCKLLFLLCAGMLSFQRAHAQKKPSIPKNFCKRIKKIQKAIQADQLPYEKDNNKKLPMSQLIGKTMYQTTYKFFDSTAVYKMNRFNTREMEYFAFFTLDTSKTNIIAYCNQLEKAVTKCGFKRIGDDKNEKVSTTNPSVMYVRKDFYVTVDMPYNLSVLDKLGYTFYTARLTFEQR